MKVFVLPVHPYSVVAGPVACQYIYIIPVLNLLTLVFSWRTLLVFITLNIEHIPDINVPPSERTHILFPNDASIFSFSDVREPQYGCNGCFCRATRRGHN